MRFAQSVRNLLEDAHNKLGVPEELAAQFESAPQTGAKHSSVLTWLWLVWADLFFGLFAVLLLAFGAVQAACVLSFGLAGVCLVGNLRTLPYIMLPEMPYWCGAILGLSLLALCVLAVIGCVWYFAFCRQLLRSYGRFHQNTLAQSRGGADFPAPVRGLLCAWLRGLCPVRRKLPVLARVGLVPELR